MRTYGCPQDSLTYLLYSDVIPSSEELRDRIVQFAIHALASNIGAEAILSVLTIKPKHVTVHIHSSESTGVDGLSATEGGTGMIVDDQNEQGIVEEEIEFPDVSLFSVAHEFDGGVMFEGSFAPCPLAPASRAEAHIKRHMHLMSQLCAVRGLCPLVRVYFNATIVASSSSVRDLAVANMDTGAHPAEVSVSDKEVTKYDVLCKLISADITAIIPVLVNSQYPYEVFSFLEEVRCSSDVTFHLLEHTLTLLHQDMQMPASGIMISAVLDYISRNKDLMASSDDALELFERARATVVSMTSVENSASLTEVNRTVSPPPAPGWLRGIADCRLSRVMRLLIPLVNGLSGSEVEQLLPFMIRAVGHNVDAVKAAFDRIIKARPPPMSRAALLVALHRYFSFW
jgi:hypothetical protein